MEEKEQLNNLATHLESLLNQHKLSAYEIKAYSNDVEVTFDWDFYYGNFAITPNEDGGYAVEDNEYYVEKFDTIQQVADYLVEKDDDNTR
jgi:hypothetical protein